MLSLGALPWAAARRHPSAAVLRVDGTALTADALDRAAAGAAARLARSGVFAGDRVALLCGNGLAFPVAYYGVLRVGAVAAPLSTASPPEEIGAALRGLRARLLVCDADHAPAAAQAVRAADTGVRRLTVDEAVARRRDAVGVASLVAHASTDPVSVAGTAAAVVLATSGTTGVPRRAVHSHAGLLFNITAVAGEMLGLDEGDVQLGALPLAHSFGMSAVLNASLLAGAAVVLVRHFDAAEVVRAVADEGVTVVQGVPTMLGRLAAALTTPPPSVRLCVVSGAPLPAALAAAVHARLCPTVVERYGMTEVSPLTMRRVPSDGGDAGDVGRPLRGVVVRVAGGHAIGELEASAPSMFLGYDRDRRATASSMHGAFFRTGDVGEVRDGGGVVLTGRSKDVIVRGGNNVAAREVERVLEGHPAVVEVAVVGMPDPDLGEEVAAALVLRRPAGGVLADLEDRCRHHLATYKRPREWHVVDRLPRTATGKVRKGVLRETLTAATRVR